MGDRSPATTDRTDTANVLQEDTANGNSAQSVPAKSARHKRGRSPQQLTVVIDTREQLPFEFPPGVSTIAGTLATGDYSVLGYTGQISIERKSWADFYGCLTGSSRERFERELQRLSELPYPAVVVEAAHDDLWRPYIYRVRGGRSRRSQVPPLVAQKSAIAWSWRYRIPFWFCGGRKQAAKWTLLMLMDAVRVIERERKAAE